MSQALGVKKLAMAVGVIDLLRKRPAGRAVWRGAAVTPIEPSSPQGN
jgi:hypothetical protein